MTKYPYEYTLDDGTLVTVHEPDPNMVISEYGLRFYARRFRAWPSTGFGWIGEGKVDILIRQYRAEPDSGERDEAEVVAYTVVDVKERPRIPQLLNSALAGGGEFVPLTGMGYFEQ